MRDPLLPPYHYGGGGGGNLVYPEEQCATFLPPICPPFSCEYDRRGGGENHGGSWKFFPVRGGGRGEGGGCKLDVGGGEGGTHESIIALHVAAL